jgi:hypothetical protein
MKFAILLLASWLAFGQTAVKQEDELARIQSEPNLEKRARMALDHTDDALKQAHDAYANGDNTATSACLEQIQRSVELADSSLKQTGKNPSRRPKHFKAAELRTRELLRRLEGFREQMSVADRPEIDRVMASVQKIHDALLESIMGKKK